MHMSYIALDTDIAVLDVMPVAPLPLHWPAVQNYTLLPSWFCSVWTNKAGIMRGLCCGSVVQSLFFKGLVSCLSFWLRLAKISLLKTESHWLTRYIVFVKSLYKHKLRGFGWWCHRPFSGGIEVYYPATLGDLLFSESSLDQNSSDIMIYSWADIPCWIGPFWDGVEIKCPEGSVAKGTTHDEAFDLHFKIVLFCFFCYGNFVSSWSRISVKN